MQTEISMGMLPCAQASLYLVLKESFKVYKAISEGLINLADRFFEMDYLAAQRGLEIYKESIVGSERLQARAQRPCCPSGGNGTRDCTPSAAPGVALQDPCMIFMMVDLGVGGVDGHPSVLPALRRVDHLSGNQSSAPACLLLCQVLGMQQAHNEPFANSISPAHAAGG